MVIVSIKRLTRYSLLPLSILFILTDNSWAELLQLSSDKTISQEGSFTLTWVGAKTHPVEIQTRHSNFSEYSTIYKGLDSASVITGKVNGDYYYRARIRLGKPQFSPWTKPLKVTVHHHTLQRAFIFFGLGAVVFVLTTLLIIIGSLKDKNNKEVS